MKTIWKYNLIPANSQLIEVKKGAEFLTVEKQGEEAVAYFKVDTDVLDTEWHKFFILGTNHDCASLPPSPISMQYPRWLDGDRLDHYIYLVSHEGWQQ